MKKFLVFILLLTAILAVAAGVLYWRASEGAPASDLEKTYLTASDRFVNIAGARVRVREEGPADAPVILLIHGFTHSLETWDAWAAALKSDYRVVRYDLLGHGLTGPDSQERYAPTERAVVVGDVLDALDVERAIIAGNSLGGLAAWRFAHDHPDRAAALVLVSPGVFSLNGVSDEPAEIPAAMKAYLMTAPEAGVAASAGIIYGDDDKLTPERLATMRDMMRREGNGAAMIKSLEEFTLPDPSAALTEIETPTLILWGEADAVIPIEQGRRMQALMPNAALIAYPGVGHAAQEEAPEETVADAIAFLDGLGDNKAGE
ncbi:alpha/beta fold hydrolase [Hyphococcus sp.]|uniref:alpha/beta fold hydrolase n=1 Tax=Hyphococcus sp. TaxID=2038636 RepID=UPI0035C67291